MRALLALAVLAVSAPSVANACAMRMRVVEAEPVNLADLMDAVDEEVAKPEVKPDAVAEAPKVEAEHENAPAVAEVEPAPKPNS